MTAPVAEAPVTEAPVTVPIFEMLNSEAALQPCDGHANKAVNAIVFVVLPSGGELCLCGNCARRHMGFEHTQFAPQVNRQQGSAN
jgi:hypothetical protein